MNDISINKKYLSEGRLGAYLEQLKYAKGGVKVLEIGKGPGVALQLISHVVEVCDSIDADPETKPGFIIDICSGSAMQCLKGKYDTVFACQVLEHLPLSNALTALDNIFQLNASRVIISVPDNRRALRLGIQLGSFSWQFTLSVARSGRNINNSNSRQHQWEIYSQHAHIIKQQLQRNPAYRLADDYRLFQ